MTHCPDFTAQVLNAPSTLHPLFAVQAVEMMRAAARMDLGEDISDPASGLYGFTGDRGYDLLGSLAVIPIEGVLVPRLGWLRPLCGYVTGYDGIRQSLANALADPAAERIAFRINSPGGVVNECFDLVDEIYAARAAKPIAAVLCENAYSAAYAIASAAEYITVPRTGGTGSIGVIWMHADFSQMLEKAGVKVTFVTSRGATRKTDGHGEIPLSPEALAAIQAEIDVMGDLFCDTVARNRGLDANAVRNLQAAGFLGQLGVDAGLADAVLSPTKALRALAGA